MSKAVGILIDGTVEWHAPGGVSDYATLCGLDANDSTVGHEGIVDTPRGQKITCPQCYGIWAGAKALRATDFDKGLAQ